MLILICAMDLKYELKGKGRKDLRQDIFLQELKKQIFLNQNSKMGFQNTSDYTMINDQIRSDSKVSNSFSRDNWFES
jgi:hypothetical protein